MALRVRVCRIEDVVPDQLRGFAVTGVTWPVIVTIVDDQMYAFPGVCPHDDVPLADYGVLAGRELTCRVHGFRFDVATGTCAYAPKLYLRRYPITIVDDEVWVDLL
jgi:nitrite reductase/ring-hydroxylating ferredoxin subunit